ncbi:rRNA-processing protein bfr2 [Maudiozyma exigua]|uniref:Protein BFR2 n=1 Tax=Maudiozyma exigua TaxID=34358 RepID=A0A9P6VZ35_MAUEX|nr:rRNA-processing protein bfr2 [Kazachstania exigua]
MAKSLSEQIADIANKPVNQDIDIEDDERNVFGHQDNDGSDNGSDSEDGANLGKAQEHYIDVGKSKLRDATRVDPEEQEGSKYKGTVGSRDTLFNDGNKNIPEQDIASEEEQGEVDEEISKSDSIIEDESSSGQEDKDEDNEEDEIADKREQLAKLVERERSLAMKRLSRNAQRDAAKGYSILQQARTFDSIIDVRIKLQKVLNVANALPVTEHSWGKELTSENKKLLENNQILLKEVSNKLVNFRNIFQAKDHINVSEGENTNTKKRSCDELDNDLRQYRIAVLKKWSSKIAAASGNALLGSGKFKAINQSAEVQVENQLADMTRLVKRTRLNRRNIIPLRFMKDLKANRLDQMESNVADDDMEQDETADIPKNYDPRRKDNNAIDTSENPYIFDDEDFYRVLLNDLIDKKIADNNNNTSNGGNNIITISSRANNKLKKNIDTKASKGRKLNFTVQEPIANYEAPVNSGYKWSDEQIDEFFAGLLGQRINFDENEGDDYESEELSDDEKQAEAQAIKDDNIQIFG